MSDAVRAIAQSDTQRLQGHDLRRAFALGQPWFNFPSRGDRLHSSMDV
jgi:hypothetical protein